MPPDRTRLLGVLLGLAAFAWWGLSPFYFKAIDHVPPYEILAHRVVWSLVLLAGISARRGALGGTLAGLRSRRLLLTLATSALLVAGNWFTFIYAVTGGLILQASLGYFINPLVNVLLGLVVLRERLRRWQWASLGLAGLGVAVMARELSGLPVVSLALAGCFGLYGLVRKLAPVGAVAGLTVETALLTPVALAAMVVWHHHGDLVFGQRDLRTDLLLIASGPVTALPLIWFVGAARRLAYATVGFLQYTAPTLQFLLAVLVYAEPFARGELVSFVLIWCALAVFSADTVRRERTARGAPAAPISPVAAGRSSRRG
jgi:chloramphenicol-sensitive protein RarD